MANILGKLKRRPKLWIGAGAAVCVGLMLLAFSRGDEEQGAVGMGSHVVAEEDFRVGQSFTGRIAPGEQVEILSPADATVMEMGFSFGDRVEAGQVLIRLNPADIWRKQAEASIAYMQAQDAALKMRDWADSPDMRRSKRALDNARLQSDEARRRRDEGERLFVRGLIARTEMEGLELSLRQAVQAVETAQEELAQTLARGQGVERRVADLQQGLAATRVKEAGSADGAVITAPRAGIVVRSQGNFAMQDGGGPKIGGKVSTGQSLAVVAALDGLDVVFKVDEGDLILLENGMEATVTGSGFPGRSLKARLLSVAGEAEATTSSDKTQFAARVRLQGLSAEDAARLRIGMTAQVHLTIYEAKKAVTVPIEALVDGGPQVRVRTATGTEETRAITLGRIGPDKAEVLSGLKTGETVVWPLGQ